MVLEIGEGFKEKKLKKEKVPDLKRPIKATGRGKIIPIETTNKHFVPTDHYTHPEGKNYPAGEVLLTGKEKFTPIKIGTKTGEVLNKPIRRFHR